MKNKLTALALMAALTSGSAFAACLPTELCARVSGLQDIDFGTHRFTTGDFQTDYAMCAYTQNDNDSGYAVSFAGTGVGSEYVVSLAAETITATVSYSTNVMPYSFFSMPPNVTNPFADANTTDELCAVGGDSGRIRVTVPDASLLAATAGTYTGTINITISPD